VAGRISDQDKERVRDASRIEAVVGDYVALRRAGGGNLKGLCPFHEEKTPSFQVRPAHGTFHCFGCGQGGDVFEFVILMEHLSFTEAVQRLADRAGIAISLVEGGTSTRSERGTRSRLIAITKAAAEFYAHELRTDEAAPARAFLAQRGFDLTAAAHFGCGFAPSGWDSLVKHLVRKGFDVAEMIRAGVARNGQRGPIDVFHRRLLWTIRDPAGDVVGFGARRIFDDDRFEAKYVNTSGETPLYRKSQVLYGLDLARKDIVKLRQVIVVEGYTDVMAMHLAGETTAVAACGTAFGEEHIGVLRRYLLDSDVIRGEVIYVFDGDAAGQAAALKAFDSDQRFAANTFVAIAPGGMDPCELRQSRGDVAVRELVRSRTPLFAFAVETTLKGYDLETAEGRSNGLSAAVPLVAKIKEDTLREDYARLLAGMVGAEIEPVVQRVRQAAKQLVRSGRAPTGAGRGSASGTAAHDRLGSTDIRPWPGRNGSADGPAGAGRNGSVVADDGAVQPVSVSDDAYGAPSAPAAAEAVPVAAGGVMGSPLGASAVAAASQRPKPDPADPATSAERETLKLVLQQPELVASGYQQVDVRAFADPAYAAVHLAVAAAGGPAAAPTGPAWVSAVADQLPAGALRSLVTELAVEPPRHRSEEPDSRYAGAILARMAERVAATQERDLRSALQRAEAAGDTQRSAVLQADLMSVTAYRRALGERARGDG
jgi:DNA primase